MELTIRHFIPGRVRLHVPSLCRRRSLAEASLTWLRARDGIRSARINSLYEGPNLDAASQSALDQHRGGCRTSVSMRRMHFDDMVEGEQRQRDPHRRRRGCADFEHGESDDPKRQDYLQVDIVVRGDSDLAVAVLEEIHDCAGAL